MSKTAKVALVSGVIIVLALALIFGCLFGIKCKVKLDYMCNLNENSYLLDPHTYDTVSVTRFASFTPQIAEREGYIFGGWFKDYSCTVPWLSTDKVNGNLTLYAKWIPE